MTHKALIIIMDGVGDRPIAELNGLTPLENAQAPFFHQIDKKILRLL